MKVRGISCLLALLAISRVAAFGQAAISSNPQIEPPTSPAPNVSPQPKIPSLEEIDQMFKQTSLGKEVDEARLRRQMREVSNRTLSDPDLVAMRARAEAARTDLEKRDRLRDYYAKFYDRMRAKADSPELKNYIDGQKTAHLNATAQNRVRPSPTLTPAVAATPKVAPGPEPPLPQATP